MSTTTTTTDPASAEAPGGTTARPPASATSYSQVDTAQGSDHETEGAGPGGRWANGLQWWTVLWIVFLHVGALAAPFFFTWQGLILAAVLYWLTGAIGVCLGYHRLLAHASFRTYPLVRRLLAVLGTLAGEGAPIFWVGAHRKHHQFSDREGDPHTPRDGAWWSHVFWLFPDRETEWQAAGRRYAKDLMKDPFMRSLDKTFLLWHLGLGLVLLAVGWLTWDLYTGVSLVVYGMFARLVVVMHITWLVNSASHMWGYRNYDTNDGSRNLWWVGLLAFGEGWHNNHHAFPGRARHGHRWWELDLTYVTILVLKRLGLAWDVRKGK